MRDGTHIIDAPDFIGKDYPNKTDAVMGILGDKLEKKM